MKIHNFDLNKNVMVIAEVGNNHEGSYTLAEELVGRAAAAGADAVKFQTFKTEHFISKSDKLVFDRFKSFELAFDQFEQLSKVAEKEGIIFLSTPLDLISANFLSSIVPAFKIASGDNNFYPLIEKVASFAKPIIMSTGLAPVQQIKQSKIFIEKVWKEKKVYPGLALLHCVTNYPAASKEINLSVIPYLYNEFKCVIGYSDHTIGNQAAITAVALGARIIEKHFTIDKNYSSFRDHQISADPKDMKALVEGIKSVNEMLGSNNKVVQDSEISLSKAVRRSIVASDDLKQGTMITMDKISWVRPLAGLAPGDEKLILGKRLTKDISRGEPITLEKLE